MSFSDFARGRQPEPGHFRIVGQEKNDERAGCFLLSAGVNSFEFVRFPKPDFFWKSGVALRRRNAISSAQLKVVFGPWPADVSVPSVRPLYSCGAGSHASWRAFGCSVERFSVAFLNSVFLENHQCTILPDQGSSYVFDIKPLT